MNYFNSTIKIKPGAQGLKRSQKPIAKRSAKKVQEIKESNKYYKVQILKNVAANNGLCRCEECNRVIDNPSGRNCAHIIAGSVIKQLYLDPVNSFILCLPHVEMFDNSPHANQMKIAPEREKRKILLKHKYHTE